MLNDEICELRNKLNKSIEQGDDYSVTYQLSIELDELITKYYEKSESKKELVCTRTNREINLNIPYVLQFS